MYKSKLQERCQKQAWSLPEYNTTKVGVDHNPRFHSTVVVNGSSFRSVNLARSSKEAQNDAAHLAFIHFIPPPPPHSGTLFFNLTKTPKPKMLVFFFSFFWMSVWLLRKRGKWWRKIIDKNFLLRFLYGFGIPLQVLLFLLVNYLFMFGCSDSCRFFKCCYFW